MENTNEEPKNYFRFAKVFKKYLAQKDKYKTFIVIGRKNIGKTYSAIEYCIRDFKRTGHKFLIIRRTWKEARAYWDDETSQHSLWQDCTYSKELISYKGYPMCRIVGLTGTGEGRGKANTGYFNAVFDDFIGKKYEPTIFYFGARLAELISNYSRENKPQFRLIMTANNNHSRSEFLNFILVSIPKKGGFTECPDINTVMYTESKSTDEGLFALHQTEVMNTAISWTRLDRDTFKFLQENQIQEVNNLGIDLNNIGELDHQYYLNVKDAYFSFGWSKIHKIYVLKEIRNFEPKHGDVIYTFDTSRLGQNEWIMIPPNARQLSKWLLDLIISNQIRISNMVYTPYLIKNIVQFVKRADLVWDSKRK